MRSISAAATILLAACAMQGGPTPQQQADQRALANARPVGVPQDCIILNRIRDTQVRDNRTIDFRLVDGRVMRSRLAQECPGLAFDERFTYRTSLDRLCDVDTITVLYSDGTRGATCGLGPFQQVEIAGR